MGTSVKERIAQIVRNAYQSPDLVHNKDAIVHLQTKSGITQDDMTKWEQLDKEKSELSNRIQAKLNSVGLQWWNKMDWQYSRDEGKQVPPKKAMELLADFQFPDDPITPRRTKLMEIIQSARTGKEAIEKIKETDEEAYQLILKSI